MLWLLSVMQHKQKAMLWVAVRVLTCVHQVTWLRSQVHLVQGACLNCQSVRMLHVYQILTLTRMHFLLLQPHLLPDTQLSQLPVPPLWVVHLMLTHGMLTAAVWVPACVVLELPSVCCQWRATGAAASALLMPVALYYSLPV